MYQHELIPDNGCLAETSNKTIFDRKNIKKKLMDAENKDNLDYFQLFVGSNRYWQI